MNRITIILAACALALAACGSPAAEGDGPGADPEPTPQANDDNGDGGEDRPPRDGFVSVRVEVDSGAYAGTHEVTDDLLDCNITSNGSGATYLDLDKHDGLWDVTFISDDPGDSPARFHFDAKFDQPEDMMESSPRLRIDTGVFGEEGCGTARLDDRGDSIVWTVEGTTDDGVGLRATIECGPLALGHLVERRGPDSAIAGDELLDPLGADRSAAADVGVVGGDVLEPVGAPVRHHDDPRAQVVTPRAQGGTERDPHARR
jgi:hypothetical protein